jgi:hypothetical protein
MFTGKNSIRISIAKSVGHVPVVIEAVNALLKKHGNFTEKPSIKLGNMVIVVKLVATQGCGPCARNGCASSSLVDHPIYAPVVKLVNTLGLSPNVHMDLRVRISLGALLG